MSTKDKQRLWFCSDYGIENKAIIKRLDENDEKYYIVTHDKESTWNRITPLLQRKIKRESLKGNIIYGVGLDGTIPGANIENLAVEAQDNGNKTSALEQVAGIIGIRMSIDEQFIAAYASNGIPGIQKTAKKLKISENGAEKITENILIRNHQAMGITLEKEAELARSVNTSMQKPKSDYETTISIDNLLNRTDDFIRI